MNFNCKFNIHKKLSIHNIIYKYFFTRTIPKLMRPQNFNFYEFLGVSRDCSQEEIKSAYLKLAKQYHPDRNPDNKVAEEKFKVLLLAYQTLNDEENRQMYNSYWDNEFGYAEKKSKDQMYEDESGYYKSKQKFDKFSQDFKKKQTYEDFYETMYKKYEKNNASSEDFNDFNKTYEDMLNKHKNKKPPKGEDIKQTITISLTEAFTGVVKEICFKRRDKCRKCLGLKSEPGHRPSKCYKCKGVGKIKTNNKNYDQPCSECKGLGIIIKNPCRECNAIGKREYDIVEEIKIPRSIKNDTNLILENKGHIGEDDNILNGDIIIKILVENSTNKETSDVNILTKTDNFITEDYNILLTKELTLNQAIFGCNLEVINIEGNKENIKIQSGLQANDKIVIKNKGLYLNDEENKRGDFIINFYIKIPNGIEINEDKKQKIINILNSY